MKRFQPLTAEQRDKAQERSQARYERIYDEVEAEHRAEWEDEFGASPSFPFCPNESRILAEAVRRIERAQLDDA